MEAIAIRLEAIATSSKKLLVQDYRRVDPDGSFMSSPATGMAGLCDACTEAAILLLKE